MDRVVVSCMDRWCLKGGEVWCMCAACVRALQALHVCCGRAACWCFYGCGIMVHGAAGRRGGLAPQSDNRTQWLSWCAFGEPAVPARTTSCTSNVTVLHLVHVVLPFTFYKTLDLLQSDKPRKAAA